MNINNIVYNICFICSSQNENQTRCSLTGGCLNKLWGGYAIQHCTTIKNNGLCIHASTCMHSPELVVEYYFLDFNKEHGMFINMRERGDRKRGDLFDLSDLS